MLAGWLERLRSALCRHEWHPFDLHPAYGLDGWIMRWRCAKCPRRRVDFFTEQEHASLFGVTPFGMSDWRRWS